MYIRVYLYLYEKSLVYHDASHHTTQETEYILMHF